MKNIFKYLILPGLVFILITSCNDEEWLQDVKIRSIDANDQWTSVGDLEMLVNGAYWHTSGEVWNDSQLDQGRAFRICASDIGVFIPTAGNGWELSTAIVQEFYNRVNTNPENAASQKTWEGCYKAISSANEAIDFIAKNDPFDDPNGWYPRIIGELHFIRAFNYYILAKTFAAPYDPSGSNDSEAFPLRIEPTTSLDNANLAPSTVEEVYTLMVEDLKIAIENLPNSFEDASNPPASYADGRADKYAATFLLARIYFQMGDWDLAKIQADDVINNSGHDLSEEPIASWTKAAEADPISNEVVWFYQFYAGDGVGLTSNWKYHRCFDVYNATRDIGGNSTDRNIACSDAFLTTVGWIDGSLNETAEATSDLRYTQLYKRFEASDDVVNPDTLFSFTRPYVWNNKYYRGDESIARNTSIPLFRLAEMYLTRAIMSFRGGNGLSQDTQQALDDINVVRERAGLAPLATVTEDDIHKERMKELAFEGDRLNYLQALGIDIPPGDRDGVSSISWKDPSLVQPIPAVETRLNNSYD